MKVYLLSCAEHGDPIPKPGEAGGQWRQRVPRSIHVRLVVKARQEGVSLNTLVMAMIAQALGRRRASWFFDRTFSIPAELKLRTS